MCQKGNYPWHLVTLKSKSILADNIFKETAGTYLNRNGRKVQLGTGKQTAKTWFGLEN
jgi:hypothetical protein